MQNISKSQSRLLCDVKKSNYNYMQHIENCNGLVIIQFKSKEIKPKPSGNRLDKEIQHILTK
jgi:hypothetical protein